METDNEILKIIKDLMSCHKNFEFSSEKYIPHAMVTHAFVITSIFETLMNGGDRAVLRKIHNLKIKTRQKLCTALTDLNLCHLALDHVLGKLTTKEFVKLFR